ncbi:MAG: hypothetical protein ACM3MG_08725, partial [Bacillota bacterium]
GEGPVWLVLFGDFAYTLLMTKQTSSPNHLKSFIKDLKQLHSLPVAKKYSSIQLAEYPFDGQLLNASALYRQSRKLYLSLNGQYSAKICSTMRSLSAQDLFRDEIEYSPVASELTWFMEHHQEVADPEFGMDALMRFNEISLFHEQNHRVLWRLLPPPPREERDFYRYLNFAESLVVALDLALGDQLGKVDSALFERVKVIYRPGGRDSWSTQSKKEYRQYLLALVASTYYLLEWMNSEDILKAVDYVLPGQKKMNSQAVRRGLELSELFTRVTNPEWQKRYGQSALLKLKKIHKGNDQEPLYMPEDPLDLEAEFFFAHRVFEVFSL